MQESLERDFQDYGGLLETVTSFKYLGRFMMAGDEGWLEVAGNLRKALKSWIRTKRILGREGEDPRISFFFKGGRPGGVAFRVGDVGLTPRMEQALGIFQHRVMQRITGRQPRRQGEV